MAREVHPRRNTPRAEFERAAKRAAQSGAAVSIYVDGVRLIISRANAIEPKTTEREGKPPKEQPPQAASSKPPRRRTGRLTLDDPFWSIEGIIPETGTESVSGNVDKYLLEAYSDPDFHV